jgi:hypothetical protein
MPMPGLELFGKDIELIFPTTRENHPSAGSYGMSLRDYFAAQALSDYGINASEKFDRQSARIIAENCYLIADAMLCARGETAKHEARAE